MKLKNKCSAHALFKIYNFRSYASGICGACTAINMFGATKLYRYFIDIFGFHGTFWLYGLVMVVEVLYGAISLPENKGQSLVKTEDKMITNKTDVGEGSSLII